MFILSEENSQRIDEMYENRMDPKKGPCIDDVFSLISMFDLKSPHVIPTAVFRDFIEDVMNNIETGRWTMLPTMWASHAGMDVDQPMSDLDVKRMAEDCSKLIQSRMKVLGIQGTTDVVTRRLALHWIQNDDGFNSMLQTAKVFNDLNKLFSKKGN